MLAVLLCFFFCLLKLSSTCLCAGGGRQGQSIKPGLEKILKNQNKKNSNTGCRLYTSYLASHTRKVAKRTRGRQDTIIYFIFNSSIEIHLTCLFQLAFLPLYKATRCSTSSYDGHMHIHVYSICHDEVANHDVLNAFTNNP